MRSGSEMHKRNRRDSSNNSKLNMSGLSSVKNAATMTKKNHSISPISAASSRNKLVNRIFEQSKTNSIRDKRMELEPDALFRDADSEEEGI